MSPMDLRTVLRLFLPLGLGLVVVAFVVLSREGQDAVAATEPSGRSGGSVWSLVAGGDREQTPGLDEDHFRRLPPEEQAAYREYLRRLDDEVRRLRNHLTPDRPDFEAIYAQFLPERLRASAAADPTALVEPGLRDTPEARAFIERARTSAGKGEVAHRVEMLHILMQRYSPRLTDEERSKLTQELSRNETLITSRR